MHHNKRAIFEWFIALFSGFLVTDLAIFNRFKGQILLIYAYVFTTL
jgi:hypothetical protein